MEKIFIPQIREVDISNIIPGVLNKRTYLFGILSIYPYIHIVYINK